MRKCESGNSRKNPETLRGSAMLLAFGLGMLAFLVAIDRPEWFNLRPVSGTAAAMSNASDRDAHGAIRRESEEQDEGAGQEN